MGINYSINPTRHYLFSLSALATLTKFKQELAGLETTRHELSSAEKLFDLPPSGYSELIAVQKEMRALEEVFAIYTEQKSAREQWAETLWANLNVQVLNDGIDGIFQLEFVFLVLYGDLTFPGVHFY